LKIIFKKNLFSGTDLLSLKGAILLFGFLACAFWWAITAFNMCLEASHPSFFFPPPN